MNDEPMHITINDYHSDSSLRDIANELIAEFRQDVTEVNEIEYDDGSVSFRIYDRETLSSKWVTYVR
jgi:hypothetical protein